MFLFENFIDYFVPFLFFNLKKLKNKVTKNSLKTGEKKLKNAEKQ